MSQEGRESEGFDGSMADCLGDAISTGKCRDREPGDDDYSARLLADRWPAVIPLWQDSPGLDRGDLDTEVIG